MNKMFHELQTFRGKWLPPQFGFANHLALLNCKLHIFQEMGAKLKMSFQDLQYELVVHKTQTHSLISKSNIG